MSRTAGSVSRLVNLRDIGGLPASGGRRTRSGVLLRSDAPHPGDAAPQDVAWPPRLVLDLRSPGEFGEPHPLIGSCAEVRSLPMGAAGLATDDHVDLQSLYVAMARSSTALIVEAGRTLASADGPTLVHCAAGKDRTGVLIAILLAAVGVERDAIAADYARTGENLPALLERLRQDPAAADMIAKVLADQPRFAEAPADAMDKTLARLEDHDGGLRGWLIAHGLEPEALERLEARLLDG